MTALDSAPSKIYRHTTRMGIILKSDPKILHRKSIRLIGHDYSEAGGYFITIVSYGREYLFGEVVGGEMRVNALGSFVQECWDGIPVHFPNVGVDVFVVMPNHVHGIIFVHENNRAGTNSFPSVGARHDLTESIRHIQFEFTLFI